MTTTTIRGVRCAGLTCAIPATVEDVATDCRLYGDEAATRLSKATGVLSRRVVTPDMCTSDLCYSAAHRLLEQTGYERDTIDALIFISQTPDYLLPATSCTLQSRLGLSKSCAAFDVNLGCSGYPYGLWLASQMVQSGLRRVLLLVGDTVSRMVDQEDRATRPLFGDAGTATLLEADPSANPWTFQLGTDGSGKDHLIVRRGLFRDSPLDGRPSECAESRLAMNGAEIFAFTLREVPPLVDSCLQAAGWALEDVHSVVMHQANEFMLKHLAKRLKLPTEKQPLSLGTYGNTSSASIPLTIAASLADACSAETLKLMLVGFGVGYSWGAATVEWGPMPRPEILTVDAVPPGAEPVYEVRRAC